MWNHGHLFEPQFGTFLVHLHTNTFHVLGTAAKDFAIDAGSLKSRLGPEGFAGRDNVRVAAEEEGG